MFSEGKNEQLRQSLLLNNSDRTGQNEDTKEEEKKQPPL